MSLQLTHKEIEELLGAFAMDAVDEDEANAIELHLRQCPRCRAEVTEHREVAALLAHTGAPAPEGVWTSILEELEPAPPALRMPGLPGTAAPTPTAPGTGAASVDDLTAARSTRWSRSSTVRMRTMVAVLSAAAVIVAVLGGVALNQSHRLDQMDASLRDVSVSRIATRAMADPHAASGKLVSADQRVTAPVVVDAKGMGYLLAANLPALPKHRTYQLWAQVQGSVLSLGVFDGATDVVQFQLGSSQRAALSRLMVTEETAPGVAATRHRSLLTGTV